MFDVIILDLNMPITDGYEACKKIIALYSECRLLRKERQINKSRSKEGNLDQKD
jgi:CheY-like chemotaxis protein